MLHRAELKAREWRSRVIDEKFLPFSRRQYHHEPLLHTKTPFTRLVSVYTWSWFQPGLNVALLWIFVEPMLCESETHTDYCIKSIMKVPDSHQHCQYATLKRGTNINRMLQFLLARSSLWRVRDSLARPSLWRVRDDLARPSLWRVRDNLAW